MDDNSEPKVRIRRSAGVTTGSDASIPAIALIAVGVLFFLDNLNIVPYARFRDYWPLAISAYGVALLLRSRSAGCSVWHWTMIAAGILLTLGNLGILHVNFGSLWPLIPIAIGVNMLLKGTGVWRQDWPSQFGASVKTGSGCRVRNTDENAIFSSVNRRIDSANFQGADLNCLFGELKVDLRGATISAPDKQAVVETNAAFGAIKLRVPETWKVVVSGSAVFGAYEDRTVPPRPVPGVEPPTVTIRGNAAFGAVEIEN